MGVRLPEETSLPLYLLPLRAETSITPGAERELQTVQTPARGEEVFLVMAQGTLQVVVKSLPGALSGELQRQTAEPVFQIFLTTSRPFSCPRLLWLDFLAIRPADLGRRAQETPTEGLLPHTDYPQTEASAVEEEEALSHPPRLAMAAAAL